MAGALGKPPPEGNFRYVIVLYQSLYMACDTIGDSSGPYFRYLRATVPTHHPPPPLKILSSMCRVVATKKFKPWANNKIWTIWLLEQVFVCFFFVFFLASFYFAIICLSILFQNLNLLRVVDAFFVPRTFAFIPGILFVDVITIFSGIASSWSKKEVR